MVCRRHGRQVRSSIVLLILLIKFLKLSVNNGGRALQYHRRYEIVKTSSEGGVVLQFNVQSGAANVGGGEAYGAGGGGGGGGVGALSSGSASSGAQSPGSPPHAHHAHHAQRLRAKEEDLSAHGRTSADGRSITPCLLIIVILGTLTCTLLRYG